MINAPWICILDSIPGGRVKLNDIPEGWDDQQVSIMRSKQYKGLFRGVSTSLRFVGDGKDYIQNIYENTGTETEVKIAFYKYYSPPTDKYLLFFSGTVDLSTYVSDEDIFVECNINESSFSTKIMGRDGVKIDISTIESIEGVELDPTPEQTVLLKQRELLSSGVFQLNDFVNNATSSVVTIDGTDWDGFTLPITLISNDSTVTNLQSQDISELGQQGFWGPASQDSIVSFTGRIAGRARDVTTGIRKELDISFRLRVYDDDTLTTINYDVPLHTNINVPPGPGTPVIWGDFDFTFDVKLGNTTLISKDAVIELIAIDVNTSATPTVFYAEFTAIDLNLAINLQWKDGTNAKGFFVYDAFKKITEAITDKKNSFISDFYGPGGQKELYTLHTGKQIRNIPDSKLKLSFEELFNSMNAIHNIAVGIEYDEVGQPYLRCEPEEYFYDATVILAVHNVSKLKKEVARDRIYNEVEVGYAKAEYEEVNGLEEYNNKFEWSTTIKTIKNKLPLVSDIRGDGYGIEFARRKQYADYPTEDTKYDNDTFIVKVIKVGENYHSEQDEKYDLVENIFSPETAYNLDVTPGRMLRAHAAKIRSGLRNSTSDIKFQFAEQKSNLNAQKTGESAILENQDIQLNTIDSNRWINDYYEFESILTFEQLQILVRNSKGIVKFSAASEETTTNYFYGWLEEINNEAEKDTAVWRLLRVDTTSPAVNLIDPTGDSPEIIVPPVDPSLSAGTFEGEFEFIFAG